MDKIDAAAPTVNNVTVPTTWGKTSTVTIAATDTQSGVSEYACTASNTVPLAGWQTDSAFEISSNGSYYAWAKDGADNVSSGKPFSVTKVDTVKPTIDTAAFSKDAQSVTITASDHDSGIKGIHINGTFYVGNSISYDIPDGVLVLELQAEDLVGNLSDIHKETVPDVTVPTIDSILFAADNTGAEIKASDKGSSGIKGIHVSGTFFAGGAINYPITEGTRYLELQAEDNAGNRSSITTKRVPGWSEVVDTITITGAVFSADAKEVTVSAETTKKDTIIDGILLDGTFYAGNPADCAVPDGARYIKVQAVDSEGDRSKEQTIRVPGWDETTDRVRIDSVVFDAVNHTATITASSSEAHSHITGIKIGNAFVSGNPVVYPIPQGTKYLEMQAVNNFGDVSARCTKRVPGWSEVVDTITITGAVFSADAKEVAVSAQTTKKDTVIDGILLDGTYYAGNPADCSVPNGARYIKVQAVDSEGDRSKEQTIRVPGWSEVVDTIAITGVTFSEDNQTATVRADTTKAGGSISGIHVNGIFHAGNPIEYAIAEGTRYLELQAQDNEGDLSQIVTRRVPGWNEVVESILVASIKVSPDFATALITAEDTTGQKAIRGIIVNEGFIEGNPVNYEIPPGITEITAQAIDEDGDQSPPVTEQIIRPPTGGGSGDGDTNMLITITPPKPTKEKQAKVRITVRNADGGVRSLTAKSGTGKWENITKTGYLTITENTLVSVRAVDKSGHTATASRLIKCFDETSSAADTLPTASVPPTAAVEYPAQNQPKQPGQAPSNTDTIEQPQEKEQVVQTGRHPASGGVGVQIPEAVAAAALPADAASDGIHTPSVTNKTRITILIASLLCFASLTAMIVLIALRRRRSACEDE